MFIWQRNQLSMEPWAAAKKSLKLVWRVPDQRPLTSSVTSVTSVANDKGDNEMIPGAVHRSTVICLTAEENPGKLQLGDRLIKRCANSPRLKWNPLPPKEVSRVAQHIRKGERGKGQGASRNLQTLDFKLGYYHYVYVLLFIVSLFFLVRFFLYSMFP